MAGTEPWIFARDGGPMRDCDALSRFNLASPVTIDNGSVRGLLDLTAATAIANEVVGEDPASKPPPVATTLQSSGQFQPEAFELHPTPDSQVLSRFQ